MIKRNDPARRAFALIRGTCLAGQSNRFYNASPCTPDDLQASSLLVSNIPEYYAAAIIRRGDVDDYYSGNIDLFDDQMRYIWDRFKRIDYMLAV